MEHASISVATMITIIVGILSVAAGAYAVIIRLAFNTYEKATEKRFADLEKDQSADEAELKKQVHDLREANHLLEKSQIKLEGEVKLLNSNHDSAKDDIASIKDTMITKTEFEPRMMSMERMLTTILHAVERSGPGRYQSGGSAPNFPVVSGGYNPTGGGYGATRPPAGPSRIETPSKGTSR